ncbi:acyl carrier protein [Xinfangfangia sp. CPCC 101601]|uniref:Acyl carrier protein n=1 Tax=Pseudogemmobacter lacusdianii TaxID=3069608 RepID=A0ABU0W186_9RHOB|nr:acyl carrier protein [Xinfangfangia sp. CPCC 101601]MDQ2067781.1 acyl carrier protein [Xinfangfangia sp. CPCC 101601]
MTSQPIHFAAPNPRKALTPEKLRDAICRCLALPKGALSMDEDLRDRATIDSLAIELITLEIEDLTGQILNLDALYRCTTVNDIFALVTGADV